MGSNAKHQKARRGRRRRRRNLTSLLADTFRREKPEHHFGLPDADPTERVELERRAGCPPYSGQRRDLKLAPFEMIVPPLAARIEHWDALVHVGIEQSDAASLAEIATRTGPSQIV